MKKLLSTIACSAILVSTASGDIARLEMGAGMWLQEPSGTIIYTEKTHNLTDTSDKTSNNQMYVWAIIKHPVPIIPNLRLEYSGIKSTGSVDVGTAYVRIPSGNLVKTELEVSQIDVIPYYNILDNTFWTTIDLGIALKVMDLSYTVNSLTILGQTPTEGYKESTNAILPLGYVRTRVEVPFTGFGGEADLKYISYAGNTVYDARVKVDYTFDITPIIQPAIEIGYRVQKIDTDKASDIVVNLEFSGLYFGAMLRF